MPYMIKKTSNGKFHVHKKGDNGPEGESLGEHDSRASAVNQIKAIYASESKKKAFDDYGDKQGEGRPTNPDDYAVVPDKDLPSTWKMPINDRRHLGLAIAALGKNAPHGQPAKLSPEDRKQAISRIRAKISKLATDDDDKKALTEQLDKFGSKGMMDSMYGDAPMSMNMPTIAAFDQDDPRVNYDPLGGNKSYACANCEFFNAGSASCQLVCGDIVPTGYCDLWQRELTKEEREADRAMPVYMVEKSFIAKVKEALQDVLGLKSNPIDIATGFKTFGPDNRYWVAFWSNNAQDRDGEWFAEKAHDQYIDRVASGVVPYPELWYWHDPRFKSGKAFYVDRVGHCVFAVGEFDDTPVGQHMKAYYAKGTDDGVSHGYLFPRSMRVDGVYYDYNTFEISPLPPQWASNPLTTFVSAQEIMDMSLNAEQKKALENRLGADFVNQLYATGETKSKAMEAITTNFKAVANDNPLEASVKALESKFDLLLQALAKESKAGKPKKGEEGSPEEEESESEEEAAAEGDKPKKKKAVATPSAIPPELIAALNKMTDAVVQQGKAIKAIESQFANPVPASRSQYTQVPPGDPALATLVDKMVKAADPGQADTPPVPGQEYPPENIASFKTVFGGTAFAPLPNGHQ